MSSKFQVDDLITVGRNIFRITATTDTSYGLVDINASFKQLFADSDYIDKYYRKPSKLEIALLDLKVDNEHN